MGSFAAAGGNVTMNMYSGFQVVDVASPIIGGAAILLFLYVLAFRRDFCAKLLIGYVTLALATVAFILFFALAMSVGVIWNFIVEVCRGTGDTILAVPTWLKVALPVSGVLAYYVGDLVTKHLDSGDEKPVKKKRLK
jgi:hypothetical protein